MHGVEKVGEEMTSLTSSKHVDGVPFTSPFGHSTLNVLLTRRRVNFHFLFSLALGKEDSELLQIHKIPKTTHMLPYPNAQAHKNTKKTNSLQSPFETYIQ